METLSISPNLGDVSRVCLGTWAMGGWLWGGTDDELSMRTIHRALDLGINFIDTAPVYGFGRSEEVVGRALEGKRSKVIIATKAGLEWTADERVYRNASAARIKMEIEDSLRRLRTDYIDLYQVHWPDALVPVEETANAMADLLKAGKVRAVGVSNFDKSTTERFQKICPVTTSQPPYNLFERQVEETMLPFTEKHGITTLAYGALCRGLLSGRMQANSKFTGDDLRNVDPKFQAPRYRQYLEAVAGLEDFAQNHFKKHVIQLAVRWLLDRGKVVALWGARRPEQLDAVSEVTGWKLDSSHMRRIDDIINASVLDPIGPEFMGSPHRDDPTYKA